MMTIGDPYQILGLDPGCDDQQIVAMYRHLAKIHHPDAGGKAETFRAINAAYEKINTKEKRRLLEQSYTQGQSGPAHQTRRWDSRTKGYYSYQPNWDRAYEEWRNREGHNKSGGNSGEGQAGGAERGAGQAGRTRETRETRGNGAGGGNKKGGNVHPNPSEGRRRFERRRIWGNSVVAAVASSTIFFIEGTMERGAETVLGREEWLVHAAAGIVRTAFLHPWSWIAAVAAGSWVALRYSGGKGKPRLVRPGIVAAVASVTLSNAGAETWQWAGGTLVFGLIASAVLHHRGSKDPVNGAR